MLADPKAQALVDEFRRAVASRPEPAEHRAQLRPSFPTSTTTCAHAFQRETELFFDSVMREDRNVLDLMTADYTFVNERLARHYGIPNVYGSQFRRVHGDRARRGRGCSARAAS